MALVRFSLYYQNSVGSISFSPRNLFFRNIDTIKYKKDYLIYIYLKILKILIIDFNYLRILY